MTRLNLGCGHQILDGYVNVDIVPSRLGRQPDVICDIRQLHDFPDSSVDEILAIHVVEHFWRWEAGAILSEWVRVLKPRGRMILECPNILTACALLKENPVIAEGSGRDAAQTMWVIYGDPAHQDPLMVHRWGYTPDSLALLMKQAGLVAVRQEPAQFKMKEPRDMRLVGFRPTGLRQQKHPESEP